MYCSVAGVNLLLACPFTVYYITQRRLYARTYKPDAAQGAPIQGINPTGGLYLGLYSVFVNFGVAELLLGCWYVYLGDPRMVFQLLYGLFWLFPIALVLVLGREGLFQIMQT